MRKRDSGNNRLSRKKKEEEAQKKITSTLQPHEGNKMHEGGEQILHSIEFNQYNHFKQESTTSSVVLQKRKGIQRKE